MDAYSLDLRKKIVEAKERGMPTVEVARAFGVGVSTVKRYAATAREGRPLVTIDSTAYPCPVSVGLVVCSASLV